MKRIAYLIFPCLLAAPMLAFAALFGQEDFLPVDEAFQVSAQRVGGELKVLWSVAPGYYLYRGRLGLKGAGLSAIETPPGEPKTDEHFGDVEVYYGTLAATADIYQERGDGERSELEFSVRYQGCADAGLCYPPQVRVFRIPADDGSIQFPIELQE